MKKIFSIFFLFLFLFFIIGYKAIFSYLQYRSEVGLDRRLDDGNYSSEETISIKIPISLPYQIHNEGYQRVSGTFEHEGEFFHIIKQKIEKDTLYVVCAKNSPKKKILAKKQDFEDIVNDLPSPNKSKNLTLSFIRDYLPQYAIQLSNQLGWYKELTFCIVEVVLHSRNLPPTSPPPELA